MEKQYFYIRESKKLIDEIDVELGRIYDLTEEELDYILNFDIKVRLGKDDDYDEDE